jgi:hypothetical protein
MLGIFSFFCVSVLLLALEDNLVFRGLLRDTLLKTTDIQHYEIAWLPMWWGMMAFSFASIGISIGCTLWAIIAQMNGEPWVVPVLIALATLLGAFMSGAVPIVTAWLKFRSDAMQLEFFKKQVVDLEAKLSEVHRGHERNSENIDRIATVTNKLTEVIPRVSEQVVLEKKEDGPTTG